MGAADRARILFVDDHALFREPVSRVLNAEPDLEVVAGCGTVAEALEILRSQQIDLVLLDFDLGKESGTAFLRRARQAGFTGRVLIVTAGISDQDTLEMVREGVSGIFLKHAPPEMLVQCIRTVLRGWAWLDQRTLAALLRTPEAGQSLETDLTGRERQVLRAVFHGLSTKEIASRLGVSDSTVKSALQRLFEKTGARNRTQLVRVALEKYRDLL